MTFVVLLLLGAVVWLALTVLSANERLRWLGDRIVLLESKIRGLEQGLAAAQRAGMPAPPPSVSAPPAQAVAQPPAPAPTATPRAPRADAVVGGERPQAPGTHEPAPAPAPSAWPIPVPAASLAARPAPVRPPPWSLVPGRLPKPFAFDWEQFMGVRLFAWVGGLALFLAVVFFVKLAFERNLIPPEVRVAVGFLAGIGLLVGGVLLKQKDYQVTAQTLCATGVVILYSASWACGSLYHFTSVPLTFLLMVIVTATAFVLAVRMGALVVAILGLVGGFLTPPLLSTGVDRPLELFGYVAILDAGLLAVAWKRRWHFLAALGLLGTVFTQGGWTASFFTPDKVFIALSVFLGFPVLFLLAYALVQRLGQENRWFAAAALVMPVVTFAFVLWLLGSRTLVSQRPGVLFSFIFGADLCVLALVSLRPQLQPAQLVGGAAAFCLLGLWMAAHLSLGLLGWALGGCVLFASLHALFPLWLGRVQPGAGPLWPSHLFPPAALVLLLILLLRDVGQSWWLWPCAGLVSLLATGLAALTATMPPLLVAAALTTLLGGAWILQTPAEPASLTALLGLVLGLGGFFLVTGLWAGERIAAKLGQEAELGRDSSGRAPVSGVITPVLLPQTVVPAASALMAFMLLMLISARVGLRDPSLTYGAALLLGLGLLSLAGFKRLDLLAPVGLACTVALEYSWHAQHFVAASAGRPLTWNVGFAAVYFVFPFLLKGRYYRDAWPWAVAALAAALHFPLVHHVMKAGFPNEYMGLVPAAFAAPCGAALAFLVRAIPTASPARPAILAWFGGVMLWFVTLIFPVQFEREWITLGWALEGVALLWLYRRIPHPGVRATGFVLLLIAFARLGLNPGVFEYHPRSGVILNWFLYVYGVVSACLMAGAWLLAPPRHRTLNVNAPPILYTLGAVLAFLLLNIEIADYFSTGSRIEFQFHGNFGRDMTYSIGWAVFALVLLSVGVAWRLKAPRYAALALLGVTVVKLFFHDLVHLRQEYRIGAFLGVAVISILASVFYQRYFAAEARRDAAVEDGPVP